jgi:hypothetical protein
MKPFNIKDFTKNIKFGNVKIANKKDIDNYIGLGYKPESLLFLFKPNSELLIYILSLIATSKVNLN